MPPGPGRGTREAQGSGVGGVRALVSGPEPRAECPQKPRWGTLVAPRPGEMAGSAVELLDPVLGGRKRSRLSVRRWHGPLVGTTQPALPPYEPPRGAALASRVLQDIGTKPALPQLFPAAPSPLCQERAAEHAPPAPTGHGKGLPALLGCRAATPRPSSKPGHYVPSPPAPPVASTWINCSVVTLKKSNLLNNDSHCSTRSAPGLFGGVDSDF